MTPDPPYWLVSACVPLTREHEGMVIVRAPDNEAAAVRAIELLEAEHPDLNPGYCDTVFVCPIDLDQAVTFNRTTAVEPAALQCCGGAPTEDGHSGWCSPELRG